LYALTAKIPHLRDNATLPADYKSCEDRVSMQHHRGYKYAEAYSKATLDEIKLDMVAEEEEAVAVEYRTRA
jgi:hypothetical protein